jgi:hypothetical protein
MVPIYCRLQQLQPVLVRHNESTLAAAELMLLLRSAEAGLALGLGANKGMF